MSLMNALASLSQHKLEKASLTGKPLVLSTAEKLVNRSDAVTVSPPEDLDQIAERIADCIANQKPIARRDMAQAPWCIWGGKHPFAADLHTIEVLLGLIERDDRKTVFRRLASAYLMGFKEGHFATNTIAATLSRMVTSIEGPWATAHSRFKLFDPEVGPQALAFASLKERAAPSDLLSEIGIGGLAAEAEFAAIAHARGLQIIRKRTDLGLLLRLSILKKWSLRENGSLIFPTQKAHFVDALVLPHAQEMPPKQERDATMNFLVTLFGDPRLKKGAWMNMEQSAGVIRRWIAGQTLAQFLDVVSEVAFESQWKYRRAFWEAVFARELIEDAWVIFDQTGAQKARQMFDTATEFGRWASSGNIRQIQSGQACLLLRIGRGIVAEWSHNGKCNIWHDADDESAPRLHQPNYRSGNVEVESLHSSGTSVSFKHHSPKTFWWQIKVGDQIEKMTGVKIPQASYFVR
jgi:EH_Signature domain